MKESLRRIILFTVIVATGSVMILIDVPLTMLIPLVLAVGFVVLVILGAVTPADIRSVFKRPRFQNLKKISFLRRLDEMKFFERKPQSPDKNLPSRKKEQAAAKETRKAAPVSPLRSFLSSLGSLGTVMRERSRQKKKVEHINELLDKTVSEKVKGSALASAGAGPGTRPLGANGGGSLPGGPAQEQDPFMSLSGDEFDVSLLDGLEDTGLSPLPVRDPEPGRMIDEPVIPLPSLDIGTGTDEILKENAAGLEEFSGFEGGESIGQDFMDLDSLDLDDIDLDIEPEEEPRATGEGSSPVEEMPVANATATDPAQPAPVKTAWIASDAPRDTGITGDKASASADMSSFAKGASGSDDDLLSSLASEVKHVKKERNLSLIRDLKDFKAPASEIEDELKETFERLKAPGNRRETGIAPGKGKR